MSYRPCRFNELASFARWTARTSAESRAWSSAWRNWLVEDRVTLFVVDDLAGVPAAFVATVFVRGEALAALRTAHAPVQSLYQAESAGRSLVLTHDAICDQSGEGSLHLLVLHAALRGGERRDSSRHVLGAAARGFHFFHMGYGLQTLSYSTEDAYVVIGGGLRVSTPADGGLVTLTRATVDSGALNMTSFLFHTSKPRFFFTCGQRELLTRALLGQADAEAAKALAVSLDAVKQSWRSIFQRVAELAPALLDTCSGAREGVRGTEKRRRLLEYLRNNPVELRPFRNPSTSERRRAVAAVCSR